MPDVLVMYVVVRKELGMSVGKTAAQCCHSVGYLFLRYSNALRILYWVLVPLLWLVICPFFPKWFSRLVSNRDAQQLFHNWMREGDHRKVVLGANDNEWRKLKEEVVLHPYAITVDRGFTEIPSGTETTMAVWPMWKSKAPRILKRLQTLKRHKNTKQ